MPWWPPQLGTLIGGPDSQPRDVFGEQVTPLELIPERLATRSLSGDHRQFFPVGGKHIKAIAALAAIHEADASDLQPGHLSDGCGLAALALGDSELIFPKRDSERIPPALRLV